ncbi:MAG: ComF family protein [Candidatus Vogelbacteria bacterium]|nr:ComF family protein [Candidatus Vogelbacteria bacterium]
MFRNLLNKIIYLLLPQRCISCGRFGEIICGECLSRLPRENNPYGAISFYSYGNPTVKKAIWLLKYKGCYSIAKKFAESVYDELIEELSEHLELLNPDKNEKVILIPVPLSKERLRERGYNQAEIFAGELVKINKGVNFEIAIDILEKIKHTPSQVSIKDREERLKNLKGAFRLNPKMKDGIRDRIAILIDDVVTTGTTLGECERVLRRGRPRKIIKVAIAH